MKVVHDVLCPLAHLNDKLSQSAYALEKVGDGSVA